MHDLLHVCEPDSRSALARGEERIEDAVADLLGYPGPVVSDRDAQLTRGGRGLARVAIDAHRARELGRRADLECEREPRLG
jgi:hypothetical protein